MTQVAEYLFIKKGVLKIRKIHKKEIELQEKITIFCEELGINKPS
jgi:hypothetical protein